MKKGRGFRPYLQVFVIAIVLAATAVAASGQEAEINKPKIFGEYYQLISDSDLYCSIFLYEEGKPFPDIRIIGAERMNEKVMLDDYDTIYIDKGQADGIDVGQIFLVVGLREKVGEYGQIMHRRSRAKIVRIDGEHMATARLERSCGDARVGDYLVPWEDMEGEIGKDEGYCDLNPELGEHGRVIYLENDFRIAGSGQWAIISLGRQHCIQIGDRVTVFHRAKTGLPREAVSSAIVIDVRGGSSTVKILSARDAVEVGDQVQIIPLR